MSQIRNIIMNFNSISIPDYLLYEKRSDWNYMNLENWLMYRKHEAAFRKDYFIQTGKPIKITVAALH
jgi:hypothetical protein